MKAQTIFDRVVRHLAKQGGPAVGKNGRCLYRGPDKRRCAVGHLIKDSEYQKAMEFNDVKSLMNCGLLPNGLAEHVPLLRALQSCHDLAEYDGDKGKNAIWTGHFDSVDPGRSLRGPGGGVAARLLVAAKMFDLDNAVVYRSFGALQAT